jgi:putative DNA primase/helicase
MSSSEEADSSKVVPFRPPAEEAVLSDEERARRLEAEVHRLARLSTVEWRFYASREDHAQRYGVKPAELIKLVETVIKENEKKALKVKAEDQQREQRAEKQRASEQREGDRKRREQEREQERADKEAAKKDREKEKAFAALIKLPKAEHEKRLIELAKRLDEDIELLKAEFEDFVGSEETSDPGDIEPWPEPVNTQALLSEVMAQFRRYVIVHSDAGRVAAVLWIFFAWVHDDIAVHSPYLVLTSAEGDTGKTTACDVIQYLTPRAYKAAELTGPNLYRFVDHLHPTLIIDDADKLFPRKPDLVHIVNVAWTRGTKIPRQDHGRTRWFDPFCPKLIAGVDVQLVKTTATRTIRVKLLPKLPHEKVETFRHVDDDDFITLRRKLMRWAADNAAVLKEARPVIPPGFKNRLQMNWELLLAIADLASGDWPKLARTAAIKLARERHEPSENRRMLIAFRDLISTRGSTLGSAEAQKLLTADPTSEWADFRGHGPITQRQIAILLDPYDIHPVYIHRGRKTERGYRAEQFAQAFKHFLAEIPARKRATVRTERKKPKKSRK